MLRREFLASMVVASALKSAARADPPPPKSRITVGRDTTFIDGPLDEQGYVDYAAWLDERFGRDVKPGDNAVVDLWRVLGPVEVFGETVPEAYYRALGCERPPAEGVYYLRLEVLYEQHQERNPRWFETEPFWMQKLQDRFETALDRPWKLDDFPDLADWLHSNEIPLDLLKSASHLSRCFRPLKFAGSDNEGSTLLARILSFEFGFYRDLARTLRLRALWHAGEKRYDEAWDDLLAVLRWGRLIAQGPMVLDFMNGVTIERIAVEGMKIVIAAAKLSDEQRLGFLRDLDGVARRDRFADKVDLSERFYNLEIIQLISRCEFKPLTGLIENIETISKAARMEIARADFSPTMRMMNASFDRGVAAMRIINRTERRAAQERIAAEQKQLLPKDAAATAYREQVAQFKPGFIDPEEIGRVLLTAGESSIEYVVDQEQRADLQIDLLKLAINLERYRERNGDYPDALTLLSPDFLPKIPGDPFSDQPLIYRPTPDGYWLYSVGINGRDDDGIDGTGDYSAEDPPDDPAIRVPFVAPPPVNTLDQ